MLAPLKEPGFGRLFVALTVSMLGDWMMLLVFGIWIKGLTGSNALAGLAFFFILAPSLFAPLLGVAIDRLPRRSVLVGIHLISAIGLLPLLAVRDASDIWIIYGVAVIYGMSTVIHPAALNGLLKEMVPEDLLAQANSSIQTVREGFRLFGPLLGAGLYAVVGGWAVALIDAATFLIAAGIIATLSAGTVAPERVASTFWQEFRDGFTFLAREKVLKHVLIGFGITMAAVGLAEPTIFAILDEFGKPESFLGVVATCQGVGAIVGAVASSVLSKRVSEVPLIAGGLALLAASLGAIALANSMMMALVFVAILGTAIPPVFIGFTTLVQKRTPHHLMGRVSTTSEVMMTVPQAASVATGAALVAFVDYRITFSGMAIAVFVGATYIAVKLLGRPVSPDDAGGRPESETPANS